MESAAATGFALEGSLQELEKVYERYRGQKGAVIPILQDIQEAFGYIPQEAISWISHRLEIPESRFFGVATFYAQFHLKPRGRNIITACSGTACHVKGSERLINGIRRELNLAEGEETTPDVQFTVEKVNCVGACSIAPVVIINKKVHGKASADKIMKEIKALKKRGGDGDGGEGQKDGG
ncbi:MAG: NADH-quinone oxidoreductase subunit NuoE [Thermodesulfovibrionales bacterium]